MTQTKIRKPRRKTPTQQLLFPLLIALMIGAVALVVAFMATSNQLKLQAKAYYHYLDQYKEVDKGAVMSVERYGVQVKAGGGSTDTDASPVYYQNYNWLVLTRDMFWLNPTSGQEWLLRALTQVYLDDKGVYWCSDGKKSGGLDRKSVV